MASVKNQDFTKCIDYNINRQESFDCVYKQNEENQKDIEDIEDIEDILADADADAEIEISLDTIESVFYK